MAGKERWTLGDMKAEFDEVVSSWTSKMPVLSNNKETEMAKKLHKVITGVIAVVGPDADMERLETMTRVDKLRAAAAADTTVQEINLLLQQFGTTALMHKVLRARHAAGKPLPETPEGTQAVVQSQAVHHMTAAQKQKMIKASQQDLKKSLRRRR